jgi:acetyltransferase-like isoleucine patch superfamily enzyme
VLVTLHRRENWGELMAGMCRSLRRALDTFEDVQLLFPMHRNPIVRQEVTGVLGGHPRAHLVEPLDYLNFVKAMSYCHLVVTDSGGIQEEAPSLGKPVLVLRETTERPEAVEAGTARLVGTAPERVYAAVAELLGDEGAYRAMANAVSPFGDGHAAERIVDVIQSWAAARLAPSGSLRASGEPRMNTTRMTTSTDTPTSASERPYAAHPTALVETDRIGSGTRIWAFCHVLNGAVIGRDCNLGDHSFVEGDVIIGDEVVVKNGVSIWSGVTLGDRVFVGPNAAFTNDHVPRARVYHEQPERIEVCEGASIGANATLIAPMTVGRYALIGAGAVVTRDVPDFGLVVGNPARFQGYVCRCGLRLTLSEESAICTCGQAYVRRGQRIEEQE